MYVYNVTDTEQGLETRILLIRKECQYDII